MYRDMYVFIHTYLYTLTYSHLLAEARGCGRVLHETHRERGFGLKPRDATSKEGGRERVVWHLVTASRLETAET